MATMRVLPQALVKLQQHVLKAPTVAKVSIAYARRGAGNAGARAFIKEHVPSLKYHNEALVFERTFLRDVGVAEKAKLTVTDDKSKATDFEIHNKTSEEILKLLHQKGFVDLSQA
eukprot:m.27114 g.27114  ORF g.27114 m.27114 type:complete len:115 (+) comp8895_c0_seq2:277-621(+)